MKPKDVFNSNCVINNYYDCCCNKQTRSVWYPGFWLIKYKWIHPKLILPQPQGGLVIVPSGKYADLFPRFVDVNGNPVTDFDGDFLLESTVPPANLFFKIVQPTSGQPYVTVGGLVAGTPGVSLGQINCRVDADLGEGLREVIISEMIEVVPGEAVAGGFASSAFRDTEDPV